mgnify:CR=1 FL=1|jgi:protein SCO1
MNYRSAVSRLVAWLLICFLTCCGNDLYAWHGNVIARSRKAIPIVLTQSDGTLLSLVQARNSLVLLSFGFTRCPNVCPAILANLAAVCRELPIRERKRVSVVFVSVDPKDDAATLAAYLRMFDAGFTGLTGSRDEIAAVARAYGAAYKESQASGPDDLIDHSTDTLLIDATGMLRMSYSMDQLREHAAVAADLLRMLSE